MIIDMDMINDGKAAGAAGASGAAGVASSGAGDAGTARTTDTVKYASAMSAAAATGAALTTGTTSTPGATGATGKKCDTSSVANSVTANTTGVSNTNAAGAKDKDKNQETQANIILPYPTATLAKELYMTFLENQSRLAYHICKFSLQDSPDLTQLNDY